MAFNAFMHERNIYRNQPDFAKLALDFPEFQKYTISDAKGQKARVDFSNTEALRTLTKILLKKDFNLDIEIPEGFLIPTVPQRLNYILWLEDLLTNISRNESKKETIRGIDIGTGACAIFPVLGVQKNGWKFIATESSEDAIMWAKKNIEKNNLNENIAVVKVNQGGSSLDEVLSSNADDCFHFCMCNPPFFENSEEIRKKHPNSDETIADVAQKDEIFVKGGELDFVRNILKDSLVYKNRICLFTSMFGKKKSFLQILKDLKEIPDVKFTSTEFCQGNTIRWGIAWTFDQSIQFQQEAKKRSKPKKTKPPLEYEIFINNPKKCKLDTIVKQAKVYLRSLEIPFTVVRSSQNFTELLLKSDKNTWSHQRRKRRELERQKKEGKKTDGTLATVLPDEDVKILIEEKDNSVMEACSATTQTACPGSQEINANDGSQSNASLLYVSESEHTENSLLLQNRKRKLDLDSEDTNTLKKSKIDDNENSESIPSEQNMLSESIVDKSSVLNSEDETISNCDVSSHSVLVQDSLTPSNDIIDISSNKTERLSDTENESGDTKVEESKRNCVDPNNPEPEGLVLYCYLQFIKGKNKVYVKMNCPPSADRNTMYQVFQFIKNKVN